MKSHFNTFFKYIQVWLRADFYAVILNRFNLSSDYDRVLFSATIKQNQILSFPFNVVFMNLFAYVLAIRINLLIRKLYTTLISWNNEKNKITIQNCCNICIRNYGLSTNHFLRFCDRRSV